MKALTHDITWQRLSSSEQKRLLAIMQEEATNTVNREIEAHFIRVQTTWIQLSVLAMQRAGLSPRTMKRVLCQWRQLYRANHSHIAAGDQAAWLHDSCTTALGDDSLDSFILTLHHV